MSLLPLNVGRADRVARVSLGAALEIAALFIKNHPYAACALAAFGALIFLEGVLGH